MRIGLYAEDLSPDEGGGFSFLEDVVQAALRAPKARHEFVLFTAKASPFGALARETGTTCVQIGSEKRRKVARYARTTFPALASIAQTLGYRNSLTRELEKARIDVLWFLGRAVVPVDLPYICTILDIEHREQPWWPEVSAGGRWSFRERLLGEGVSRAALVIVPNEAGREQLQRCYGLPDARMRVLTHPTPTFLAEGISDSSVDLKAQFGVARKFLFYPAQFWPHKNHLVILHALKRLDEVHGLQLDAVFCGGDKGNLEYVKAMAQRLGLEDRVHFVGFVDRKSLVAFYKSAVCLAYASYFGPENLPPLEAFALGCPVVAADIPGARHQLDDAAILVDPAQPNVWASAIASIIDGELRSTLTARAKKRAAGWTADDYVRDIQRWLDGFERIRECWPPLRADP